jgi:hypothetical protein
MENLAGDSELAGHWEDAFAPLNPLDRLQLVSRRKLTCLSL